MKLTVLGTGHTKFGKASEDIRELMRQACHHALDEAELDIEDLDAVYIANFSSSFAKQCHLPAVLATQFKTKIPITRVEAACASGGLAIKEAAQSILSGINRRVLIVGVEKMTDSPNEEIMQILASAASKTEMDHGATFPSLFALMAQRHMTQYGTTEEQLALVSVKNHTNALRNPWAQFQKPITVADVLASRPIASPLKLLDCSPITDGAAALILGSEDVGYKTSTSAKPHVYLRGFGHATDAISLFDRKDIASMPAVVQAAQRAYAMAQLKPEQIHVAELHDCFTIAELIEMEELGFCPKGKAGQFLETGATQISGIIPVNPSGGLKAKGHPIGATGVSQAVEIVKQLQGKCGERQVLSARYGLCCNVGGSGASAVVTIFGREGA